MEMRGLEPPASIEIVPYHATMKAIARSRKHRPAIYLAVASPIDYASGVLVSRGRAPGAVCFMRPSHRVAGSMSRSIGWGKRACSDADPIVPHATGIRGGKTPGISGPPIPPGQTQTCPAGEVAP